MRALLWTSHHFKSFILCIPFKLGTNIIFILQRKELRYRKVKNILKFTQLVNGSIRDWTQASSPRACCTPPCHSTMVKTSSQKKKVILHSHWKQKEGRKWKQRNRTFKTKEDNLRKWCSRKVSCGRQLNLYFWAFKNKIASPAIFV